MFFTDSAFIGINLTSGYKSFTYAALDKDLNLFALADGEIDDLAAFIAGQSSATVAVNAPAGVNRGLVRDMLKKKMLTPNQIRRAELRLAEHELRERGIAVTKTAASAALCPEWMRVGFKLYRKLQRMGFQRYPEKDLTHQILETNSYACFCVLAGHVPLARLSLEGRLQRQIILYEHGLRIKTQWIFLKRLRVTKLPKVFGPWSCCTCPISLMH
jgi:hypothetical protein